MRFFNFGKKDITPIEVKPQPFYSEFSTPFGKIGNGDLTRPHVRATSSAEPFVRFGYDNLYPQLINQMFYTPLNGGIISFKATSVIGNGFELESVDKSGAQKVKEFAFMRRNDFRSLIRKSTFDLIMHGRICVLVCRKENGDVSFKRLGPEKVRNNELKTMFTVSDDWSRMYNQRFYPKHTADFVGESVLCFEIDDIAGQDIYPLPLYTSALNWAYVESEMAYLQKSNIINSIFPSFMITLAKNFGSTEELEKFKQTVDAAKGAPNAGRIITFIGSTPEQLPTITPIPIQNNDKLFNQTSEDLDAAIAKAHLIDPILMGIRVSGKLGSGLDIKEARMIFEQNHVRPLRELISAFADELLQIGGVNSNIRINTTQIIDDRVVDTTKKDAI